MTISSSLICISPSPCLIFLPDLKLFRSHISFPNPKPSPLLPKPLNPKSGALATPDSLCRSTSNWKSRVT